MDAAADTLRPRRIGGDAILIYIGSRVRELLIAVFPHPRLSGGYLTARPSLLCKMHGQHRLSLWHAEIGKHRELTSSASLGRSLMMEMI
jgi:hypothetical protein